MYFSRTSHLLERKWIFSLGRNFLRINIVFNTEPASSGLSPQGQRGRGIHLSVPERVAHRGLTRCRRPGWLLGRLVWLLNNGWPWILPDTNGHGSHRVLRIQQSTTGLRIHKSSILLILLKFPAAVPIKFSLSGRLLLKNETYNNKYGSAWYSTVKNSWYWLS